MDERTIKRLLVILAASILAIILIKVALIKTYTTLNKAVAEKKQTPSVNLTAPQLAPTPHAAIDNIGSSVTSGVGEATTEDSHASASVSKTQ